MRSGIDYVGQYRCNARAKGYLRRLGTSTSVVVDWYWYHRLREQGYVLDIERDNKSVWSPEWIGKALGRYGNLPEGKPPVELSERISKLVEEWQASTDASSTEANLPRARAAGSAPGSGSNPAASGSEVRTSRSRTARGATASATSEAPRRIRKGMGASRGTQYLRGRDDSTRRAVNRGRREVLADHATRSDSRDGRGKWDPLVYGRAKAATLAALGGIGRRSKVLTDDVVISEHIHPGHFSGAPYFCSNRDAVERTKRDVDAIASGRRAFDPFVAGRRVQHGPNGPKGRLVWMASLSTTVLATRFAKPAYYGLVGRPGTAYARTNVEVGTFISELQSRFEFVYCLDFSAFDASLPAWMLNDCFDILASHLEMDAAERELFDRLVNDFIHSRIVLPDQSVWQVHRGVPSGSAFTSLIDSIANYMIIQYVMMRTGARAPRADEMMVLGDDSIVGSNFAIAPRDIAKFSRELGVNLSVDKTKRARRADMVSFLGHEWLNSRPHRSMQDIAVRMAFPERHKYRSKADSVIRGYSFTADAVEALEMFLKAYEPHSRDIIQRIRDALWSAGITGKEELSVRDGPGRLRFQVDVEARTDVAKLMTGTRLAEVGIWF